MFQRAESAAPVAARSKTKQMKNRTVGIIGGGASGLMAAISAARAGAQVTPNRTYGPGWKENPFYRERKMQSDELQDGAGMLPLQPEGFSHEGNSGLWRGGNAGVFKYLGIVPKDRNGYVYPNSDQAASVLDVLRWETERLGIRVLLSCQVSVIKPQRDGDF